MKETFKHIRSDKSIKDAENVILTALYVILIFGLIYILTRNLSMNILIYVLIFLAIILSSRLIRMLYKDWSLKRDIIGNVNFESNKITFDSDLKEILISDISTVNLTFNYIKGEKYHSRDIIHNGLAKMEIISLNGQAINLIFLIETKTQLDNFSKILKEYYKRKIKIDEFLGRHMVKTFLLKPKSNWKYEEIKKLKSELNIETI